MSMKSVPKLTLSSGLIDILCVIASPASLRLCGQYRTIDNKLFAGPVVHFHLFIHLSANLNTKAQG